MCDTLEVIEEKTVTVDIIGGLGNQLFGYSAGFFLASLLKSPLICLLTQEYNSIHRDTSSLESLKLPGTFLRAKNSPHTFSNLNLVISKTKRIIRKFSRLNEAKHYYSNCIGYDRNLEKLESPTHIHGYFQSCVYAEGAKKVIQESILENIKLSQFADALILSMKAIPTLVVHIRLGDYRKPENDFFGILSPEYYKRALKSLTVKPLQVYVFSDEIAEAKKNYSDSFPSDTNWIDEGGLLNPLETLAVMSEGTFFIIANSTFSWWAAFLSESGSNVIAPAKWFKGQNDPENLYPKDWLPLESLWE